MKDTAEKIFQILKASDKFCKMYKDEYCIDECCSGHLDRCEYWKASLALVEAGYGDTKPLKAEIEKLKAEIESIRNDTAKEILQSLFRELSASIVTVEKYYGIAESVGLKIAISKMECLAKEYGVDLTKKDGEK